MKSEEELQRVSESFKEFIIIFFCTRKMKYFFISQNVILVNRKNEKKTALKTYTKN